MANDRDVRVTKEFSAKCVEAHARLWREMEALGLRKSDGWRIVELTRGVHRGTEMVLRPVHSTLSAPDGLECVVLIEEHGYAVHSVCNTPRDSEPPIV
jgi:hypothetical protein